MQLFCRGNFGIKQVNTIPSFALKRITITIMLLQYQSFFTQRQTSEHRNLQIWIFKTTCLILSLLFIHLLFNCQSWILQLEGPWLLTLPPDSTVSLWRKNSGLFLKKSLVNWLSQSLQFFSCCFLPVWLCFIFVAVSLWKIIHENQHKNGNCISIGFDAFRRTRTSPRFGQSCHRCFWVALIFLQEKH